ncbi:ATP-binding protein [Deinococcus peraridilitoris]|uniref:histidine kinase n=1 Tax=Deinococcus peraridilitoris (strain DSM 19664 / LMG 22246 / CIP 109416 / KR-200) TaxID=937777 RepID=L0A8Y3_DEIPD|nr:ATP-binding protein [Deinococcus peraridilitoris]AFZ69587.1 bacteriophytochrome (light-regulated signal transduction histidine kinase) [Deinococcus peraridilitoris DSM 19664]
MSEPHHHTDQPPTGDAAQVDALLALSEKLALNEREQAALLAHQALTLADQLLDEPRGAQAALRLATLEWRLSRHDSAMQHASDALTRFRRLGDAEHEAWSLRLLGNIHGVQSQYVPATEYLQAAAALSRETNNRACLASCLNNLGIIADELGDYATALEHLFEALQMYDEHDRDVPITLNNISSQYRQLGQFDRAMHFHQQTLELARSGQEHPLIATFVHNMAETLRRHRRGEQAQPLLQEALMLARQASDRQTEMLALDSLGLIQQEQGEEELARGVFEQGLSIASTVNHPLAEVKLLMHHAATLGPGGAVEQLERALALAVRAGLKAEELEVHDLLVSAHHQPGNLAAAFDHLKRARTLERELFNEEQDRRVQALHIQYDLRSARELAEAQRVLNEQLLRANEELDAFTSTVSHDLRAPLRHIISFSAVLRRVLGEDLPERALKPLGVIESSAARMNVLTDALLSFARTSRQPLQVQDVNLHVLLDDAREDLHLGVTAQRVQWRVESLPVVRGDPVLLRQVLVNLLSNAVKYSAERDTPVVSVTAEEAPGEVVLTVQDNGVGFDPRHADKLFGMFSRLHQASTFEGTGIGLATAKRIVERHGGRIWAESTPGHGAVFHLSLPKGTQA